MGKRFRALERSSLGGRFFTFSRAVLAVLIECISQPSYWATGSECNLSYSYCLWSAVETSSGPSFRASLSCRRAGLLAFDTVEYSTERVHHTLSPSCSSIVSIEEFLYFCIQ
jgi:hypothetical protein